MKGEVINIWMGVSSEARAEYMARRNQGDDYNGPMDERTFDALNLVHDLDTVERLFKAAEIGDKTYSIFSLYSKQGTTAEEIKAELDYINEQWPGHFIIGGAWHWDGRQAGTEWVDGEITGEPYFPINEPELLKFMPDVYDDASEEFVPATELAQVNMLAGQQRRFN